MLAPRIAPGRQPPASLLPPTPRENIGTLAIAHFRPTERRRLSRNLSTRLLHNIAPTL